MFKIREFSRFAKVSPRMLRYYDSADLLKPAHIDEDTGYRYYSAYQIPSLIEITTLRDAGLGIEEISNILKNSDPDAKIEALYKKQQEIMNNISKEETQLRGLEAIIKTIKEESLIMDYTVKIKSIPSYKVLSIRDNIPTYDDEIGLWAKLGSYAMDKDIAPAGPPFAIYHDGEHRDRDIDVEVTMPVSKLGTSNKDIIFRETEPIDNMASLIYKGRYEDIDSAFFHLAKWIEESPYTSWGKVRQVSLKGAWNEEDPDEYLTEIQMPIRV